MTDHLIGYRPESDDEARDRLFGVMVTYRRPTELSASLRHLAGQTRHLDALVVVDNSPNGETKTLVSLYRSQGMPVEYIAAPENLGPAGGIALGMKRVLEFGRDDDWILLLDDDNPCFTVSLLEDLHRLARVVRRNDPRTAAVGVAGWLGGGVSRLEHADSDSTTSNRIVRVERGVGMTEASVSCVWVGLTLGQIGGSRSHMTEPT